MILLFFIIEVVKKEMFALVLSGCSYSISSSNKIILSFILSFL